MAELVLYGTPISTYVRTARITLAEKGVAYDHQPIQLGSAELRALHPFGRIPVLQHGPLKLFESFAIARYVDEAFDGPPLQPDTAATRAVMTQWVSAVLDSAYPTAMRGYLLVYVRAQFAGEAPDRAVIDAALPGVRHCLDVFDQALQGAPFLAGEVPTLADFFLAPIIYYLRETPEAGPMIDQATALARWYDTMAARPSLAETVPPHLE